MNCHDFDNYLQEQLDGDTASAPRALTEHLATCERCREMHQAARQLETGLEFLPWPSPPLHLADQIVGKVLAERRQRIFWRYRLVGVAAAAAVLLILLPLLSVMFQWGNQEQTQPLQQQILVEKNQNPEENPAAPESPSLRTSVAKASDAVASLTTQLADKTRKEAEMFWSAASPPELPSMPPVLGMEPTEMPLEPAAESLKEATAEVTNSFQVVAGSGQRAVNYFARAIPTFKSKTKTQ